MPSKLRHMGWNPGSTLIAISIMGLGGLIPLQGLGFTESNFPPTWWFAALVFVVVVGAVLNMASHLGGETNGY